VKPHHQDSELRNLLRIFRRRKHALYSIFILAFLAAVALCAFSTRRYSASAQIELQKSGSDGLGLDSMFSGASSAFDDPLSLNVDLQTQASILQSDTLAIPVIQKLKLEQDPDFAPHFNPIGWFLGVISPSGVPDPPKAPLQNSPARRERVLSRFEKNLSVRALAGTRLIEVTYRNPNPRVAASVVNELVQALIDYTFQVRYVATNQTSKWLEAQLNDLREQTERLQSKVVAIQKATGLFGVGGTDPNGKPVIYSPALEQLQEATANLSQAQANRILKGSINEVAKTGNAELLSQLSGPGIGTAGSGVLNSLGLIQTLRSQEASAEAQLEQDSIKYGPAYPKLREDRASVTRVQQALKDEVRRVAARAENDYQIAEQSERGARTVYADRRKAADKLNDKTIEYVILQKEASESQELYQSLLTKLREAGVLAGLRSSNLTVVEPATPPARPSSPKTVLYLAAGLAVGIFCGLAGALFVDFIDNRIHSADDIEQLEMPVLGLIPTMQTRQPSYAVSLLETAHSSYGEAIRRLRSTLILSKSVAPPKVVLVASGGPGEGKSTISLNLAAAFAQLNQRVLLVEIDMRRPVLQKRLQLTEVSGLSQLLSGAEPVPQEATLPQIANLALIGGGPVPPYPSELLSSDRFGQLIDEWKREYDVVVIDSPPVLPVSDVQSAAGYADAILLLARSGLTTRSSLQRAYSMLLPHAKPHAIGVLLNAVATKSSAYYEYYGYKQSGYYRQ
jgi:capsular exopolysaccharide synthesis family protein